MMSDLTPEEEMSEEVVDNLDAAMAKVAEDLEPTRRQSAGSKKGEPTAKQVLLRATENDHARWKEAADKKGISMAEFIRDVVNAAAAEILDCPHPSGMKRFYPWATTCLQCGAQWVHDKRKPRGQNHK
jgi:predicted HicB family RNase H-like nuclease